MSLGHAAIIFSGVPYTYLNHCDSLFSKAFDLSDENLLCVPLTMHAKILLADSNIAPSITKRAKLFVLFCVVPLVFTVGLHTLRFFSGQKRPTTNWNFLFSPINHHGKKNCFTQQFSSDWFIYISLNFQGIYIVCLNSNVTEVYSKVHQWKVQKTISFFYLHFTWLCVSWKLQRILKK